MKLLLLQFLVLLCLMTSVAQKITSIGEHSSGEFLWAIGVNNLQFNICFTDMNSSNYNDYIHDWQHVSADGTTLVSFRTQITSSSVNESACYNGTVFTNPQSVSAYGIDYRIDCALVNSTLESQFTIFSPLGRSYDGSMVKVVVKPPGVGNYAKGLRLKYCNEIPESDYLEISGDVDAQYNSIANYTCSNSGLVINDTYVKETYYSRTCNYDAKWSDEGTRVECWFAPEVNISIIQNGLISSGILVSQDVCMINCNISAVGNPTEANATYYKNKVQLDGDNFTVTSSDNGATVSCQMTNSYVSEVDGSAGFSQSIKVDVYYQPESNTGNLDDTQFADIGQDYNISVMFNANPRLNISDTKFYFAGDELNSSNARIDYEETTIHIYRYTLVPVSNKSFGIYTLSTQSPAPQLAGRMTNFTVNLSMMLTSSTSLPDSTKVTSSSFTTTTTDDSAQSGAGLEPGIIAAIAVCSTAVIVLFIVGGLCFYKRRSLKSNSSAREERDNPLYGTTTTSCMDDEYATVHKQKKKSEKEEKANPLYQSTQEANGATIEPAYGSVGQEGDSNEAGPSGSVEDPNTSEVTYAVVKKPKKNKKSANIESATNQDNVEVTYAAVNKPKKKDKAGTSDSTVDPNTSEVAYAAVSKPKKNK